MNQIRVLVQVSNDTFSHMADDLKYIGQTTFRGSCSYEIPDEGDLIAIYSGFNDGNLFPFFIAKIIRVYLKNKFEYICSLSLESKVVRISKEFAEFELKYFPACKTNMTEQVDLLLNEKIKIEIQKSPSLNAWN